MASRALHAVLVLVVCGWGMAQCKPAAPSTAPRQTVAPAPRVVKPAPRVMKPSPRVARSTPKPKPLPKTGCRKLLDAYRGYASRIRYPANLPYLPLLGVGEKIVKRWARSDQDPVCQAQLRHVMNPLFGRLVGPGVGQPPTLPKAEKK